MSYYDVTVLPTWKGWHKVGDLLSFALPGGAVRCGMVPPEYGPDDSAAVRPNFDWGDAAGGPYVLLLHESRGDETQVTPGLRRAGSDGTQGGLHFPPGTTIAINTTESVIQTAQPCFLAAGRTVLPLWIKARKRGRSDTASIRSKPSTKGCRFLIS